MFTKASENSLGEIEARKKRGIDILEFGISFLDEALNGIIKSDLILIGAPSGVGKTALCCNITLANIKNGKRVHYVALEAERFEIEARLKFQLISEMFFSDPNRPQIENFCFSDWYLGRYYEQLQNYEDLTHSFFQKAFSSLFTFYKGEKFGIDDFIESVIVASDCTDLIIVDHVHYFDLEETNENKEMKKIASTARTLALENNIPIILISHLRKRDKANSDLVANLDEFHGSSDLYKIATKVITFAGGSYVLGGGFETFFRIPKNRTDGGVTRFLGRTVFSPKKGAYEKDYRLGHANLQKGSNFDELPENLCPTWAKSRMRSPLNSSPERHESNSHIGRQKTFPDFKERYP